MIRIRRISVFVMIFLLVSVGMVYAIEYEQESMRVLKSVFLIVEELKPDIEKDGLHKSSIQTDVELKLRMAGIKVLTKEESLKEPGMPILSVLVASIQKEFRYAFRYAFVVRVQLVQNVFLARDPKIFCLGATTWRNDLKIGTVGADNVRDIRNIVKDEVDVFINDYLEMNPK